MPSRLKILLLVFSAAFLFGSEEGCRYSHEYMESFFAGSPFDGEANDYDSREEAAEKFERARKAWLVWAEKEIGERFSDGTIFEKRYRWQAPKAMGYGEIASSIRGAWGKAYAQGGTYGLEVEKTIRSLGLLEEFQKRLADPGDSLNDAVRYRDLLSISSIPWKLYWQAEELYWDSNYEKAATIMSFLLLSENKDGFVRGAAHYFLGRSMTKKADEPNIEALKEISQEALDHFVKVPKYPTCLTYISYAYIDGAKEAAFLGDYRAALALTCIDVPSVDRETVLGMRHYAAARYCAALRDHTNCVRHLQEAAAANASYGAAEIMRTMNYAFDKGELWNWCATNRLEYIDTHNAIVSALTNENSVVEFDDLYEALTIKWPSGDQLPQSIMTNRVLNNNYFKPPRDAEYKKYDSRARKEKEEER